ncbi:MOSC domain-containing protein [Shimia biformata]|uniref:MOSC domain-containing protein n=1 Tax=Shimia biformata TaxID=1294299 RepID=UPI00194FA5E9|nr:MOSC domain-containing protein [Shimia biformata]
MPALIPTDYYAEITWIGRVADSASSLKAAPLSHATLQFGGIAGECHGGLTRLSCSRVTSQHPKGTEIANVRQLSIVSQEDLDAIAAEIGLDALHPSYVGASLVLSGIPDFTHIPPSSRLQADSGATLVVDMENRPCIFPGRVIEADFPGAGKKFKPAATNRRGVTAWVERPGEIQVGGRMRLHVPDQPVWAQLAEVRSSA